MRLFFSESNIIKLAPGDTISRLFDWHIFVKNFSKNPGIYKAKVKYIYIDKITHTVGADQKPLTPIETFYSNVVEFKIEESK